MKDTKERVRSFARPKRVSKRNELLGIRPVGRMVMMRWADETGIVDERLCMVVDEKTIIAFPKLQFEPLKDEVCAQLTKRLKIVDAAAPAIKKGLHVIPVKKMITPSSGEKKEEPKTAVDKEDEDIVNVDG